MSSLLMTPLRLIGWAGAGVALAVGWKLGGALYDMLADQEACGPICKTCGETVQDQPLWKRQFSKVSE